MLEATIATYGGPYADAKPIKNPQTQLAAAKANQLMDDAAQLTRTGMRAMVSFAPVAAGNPTVLLHRSVWGSGDAQKPVITRTGVGLYVATYPASLVDGLGATQAVSFIGGFCSYLGATLVPPPQITSLPSGNVVNLTALSTAFAASDLGAIGTIAIWLR